MAALRKAVGRRVREAREKAQMTQEALAQKLRVETTTLSRYERGEIGISWEMLERVADALQVSVPSLVGDVPARGGVRPDEEDLLRAYRTLTPSQKRVARWMVPRLRELK
jgi:transcriptional regulator with XRE-family HTH domain